MQFRARARIIVCLLHDDFAVGIERGNVVEVAEFRVIVARQAAVDIYLLRIERE